MTGNVIGRIEGTDFLSDISQSDLTDEELAELNRIGYEEWKEYTQRMDEIRRRCEEETGPHD